MAHSHQRRKRLQRAVMRVGYPGQRLREGIVEDRWEGSIPTRPCLVLLPSYRVTASGHWEPMSIGASHVKMVESVIENGGN